MSSNQVNCPSCGAPVKFAWRQAVQAACPYCHAILIRHADGLEQLGEAALLPKDASPIQIGTEGRYDNRNFRVVGRIHYGAEDAEWNEWHIVFFDSRQPESGWLSDALAQYAVSFLVATPQLPSKGELERGRMVSLAGANYMVTNRSVATYLGFEGELPFKTTDRTKYLFIDLRTEDARFGTIDYSEDPPLLFLGRQVEFDELQLTGLREFEGW